MKFRIAWTVISLVLFGSVRPMLCRAQGLSDEQQIRALINQLSADGNVKEFLDPDVPQEQREKEANKFSDPYKLTIVPSWPITISNGKASVQAQVHFQKSGSELEHSTRLEFVKRNDRWYFANYSFTDTPLMFVVIFVAAMLIAFGYAGGVLWAFFSVKKRKRGNLKPMDFVRIYNPFTWFSNGDPK
jgi:hypothetical protein